MDTSSYMYNVKVSVSNTNVKWWIGFKTCDMLHYKYRYCRRNQHESCRLLTVHSPMKNPRNGAQDKALSDRAVLDIRRRDVRRLRLPQIRGVLGHRDMLVLHHVSERIIKQDVAMVPFVPALAEGSVRGTPARTRIRPQREYKSRYLRDENPGRPCRE